MKKPLLITLFVVVMGLLAAQAQGGFANRSQCYINGQFVTVVGNCPATSSSGSGSSGVNSNINSGFYNLGYAFGRWLFSSGSDPQADFQKQQMMEELARRQAEAERQHREEEARRLTAMYNRLSATLKLRGLPELRLKQRDGNSPGLKPKLRDSADGQAGINGLPGIYLNSDEKPYGIPGLPGIYTGGPGQGSGLRMKTRDDSATPAAQAATFDPNNAPAATFDPSKMTPQQLADVAEMVSKLPPEEQQRLMAAAQNKAAGQPDSPLGAQPSEQANAASTPGPSPVLWPQTAAQPVASLQQQANVSQAAASAPEPENASAKARSGFDTPLGPAATLPVLNNSTPSMLRPPGTAVTVNRAPAAPPVPSSATSSPAPPQVANEWVKQFLFPGSQSTSPFPKNPNPPLTNPLREEQKLQAELKTWDNWAIQRATHIYDKSGDKLYPEDTERSTLNTSAVKQYAPELLNRYNTDTAFRQRVDLRLQYTNEHVALDYYQGLAEAHKAAILAFQAELDKLAAAGTLDRLVPLEDQYRLHPERRQIVQSVWDRVSADEQATLAKVQAEGSSKLDKEYQFAFQLIRGEVAQQR